MTRTPYWERRLVAAGVAFTAAAGALAVLALGAAGVTDLVNGAGNTPDAPLYVAAVVLGVPTLLAAGRAALLAGRYAAGRPERGRRVALWFLAAWLLWFAWGVPTSSAFLSAALVVCTAVALPVAGLVLLVSRLARRERT